jgi:hypothetical protein
LIVQLWLLVEHLDHVRLLDDRDGAGVQRGCGQS